jgi:hypothetical protein
VHGRNDACPVNAISLFPSSSIFERIGWEDLGMLGLSIGCYYDTADALFHFFDRHTVADLLRYLVDTAPLLVTFNGIRFDLPLMRALVEAQARDARMVGMVASDERAAYLTQLVDAFDLTICMSYDILAQIWRSHRGPRVRGVYGLGDLSRANGLGEKSGQGAAAPWAWSEGRYAEVINYCQHDVLLTKGLLSLIIEKGMIVRGDGQTILVSAPEGMSLEGQTLFSCSRRGFTYPNG